MDNNLFSQQPPALTLSQLNATIGNAVRQSPVLQGAWVMAELSDVRITGGHCYMELIEKNTSGQTVAKLRANIWANRLTTLRRKFFSATQRDIVTGMKVMVFGATNHHPVYGLSFNITDIDPSYTLGDMERLRREILMKLNNEGILEHNKQQWFSPAPQRIAVISAEGAAGYGDFMNQLLGNQEGFVFYPHLFPAVMQGDRTSVSVRAALEMIEQTIDLWDCVAIIRGGGSTTDLNGFDDYELARTVALFPLPVLVGIGHERDRTVLDEIAHTRLKTPTAVASFLIDTLHNAYDHASGLTDLIARYANERLQGEARRLQATESMLPVVVSARLTHASTRLDRLAGLLQAHAGSQTQRQRQRLEMIETNLQPLANAIVRREERRLESLRSLVEVLSPTNTLKRGYSITRVNGHAVTNPSALKPGTRMETILEGGSLFSIVETPVPQNS